MMVYVFSTQALEQVLENTFKQMLEKGRKLVLEQVCAFSSKYFECRDLLESVQKWLIVNSLHFG